jgi:hypothetical protein
MNWRRIRQDKPGLQKDMKERLLESARLLQTGSA